MTIGTPTQGLLDPSGDRPQAPLIDGIEIERLVGEGGFGSVWLGWQVGAARRRVAVKVMRGALASDMAMRQFQLEQAALASLQHGGIATMHLTGVDRLGRSFVVLEWLDGAPITVWCNQHRASIRERMRLLAEACDAVQHAHQRGILHCDLKPANIMVAEQDGQPVVKVIDFGLTRGRDGAGGPVTCPTLGTPEYMAPEQRDPNTPIDARADVYALGVILTELLCGDTGRGTNTPSRAISRLNADQAAAVACDRATTAQSLLASLVDGPDWIAARSLAAAPASRYASVDAMRNDIEAWLAGWPLAAGPDSVWYRSKLFVRRNRAASIAASLALTALIGGAIASTLGWIEASHQFAASQQQLARAKGMLSLTRDIVLGVSPEVARDGDTRIMRMVLSDTAREVDAPGMDPYVRYDAARLLGEAYYNLGEFDRAKKYMTIARTTAADLFGAASVEAASTDAELGELSRALDQGDTGIAELRRVEAILREELGPEHEDRLRVLASLGWALVESAQAEHAIEGRGMLEEVHARRLATLGPDHELTLHVASNLAEADRLSAKLPEAIDRGRKVLEARQSVFGEDHPDSIISANNLAVCLLAMKTAAGREEAVAILDPAAVQATAVLGPLHPYTLRMRNNLASALRELGQVERAERMFRELLEQYGTRYGESAPSTLVVMNNLALALEDAGKVGAAIEMQSKCLELRIQALGPNAAAVAIPRLNLGRMLAGEGRVAEGLELIAQARPALRTHYGFAGKAHIAAVDAEASALLKLGRADEARALLQEVATNEAFAEVVPGLKWRVLGRLATAEPIGSPEATDAIAQARAAAKEAGALAELESMLAPPEVAPE